MGGRSMDESRRDLIKKATVVGGIVWATPIIQSMTKAAAAAGTPAPTTTSTTEQLECDTPSMCEATVPCASDPDPCCVCAQTVTGSKVCVRDCSGFVLCSGTICPTGYACIVFACPGLPVCVELCNTSSPSPPMVLAGGNPFSR